MQVTDEELPYTKVQSRTRTVQQLTSTSAAALRAADTARRDWADALLAAGITDLPLYQQQHGLPELDQLQEQQERLTKVCENFDKLCLELEDGRHLLSLREEELMKLKELEESLDAVNLEEAEDVLETLKNTEADNEKLKTLRNRLEEQLMWLHGRRQWLGQLNQWIRALMRATEEKELDEAELNHLDDWFSQLRHDLGSSGVDTESPLNGDRRHRVTDSPYVLRWLQRAISYSSSNLSMVSGEQTPTQGQTPRRDPATAPMTPMSPMSAPTNEACSVRDDSASVASADARRRILRTQLQQRASNRSTESVPRTPTSLLTDTTSSLNSIELTQRVISRN